MIKRTLLKTLSYAAMHMSIAIVVAYALSGSWKVALAIGLLEPCIQTIAFFFHERAWHKIEKRAHEPDIHNSVIDSISPASETIEGLLRNKNTGKSS
jgi:uncharacterized membrane protein